MPPELVVGTLIPDETAAKVTGFQTQLGRRHILAARYSGGDREMLEWAMAVQHPSLALLIDHDDADREFAYLSASPTLEATGPITEPAPISGGRS